VQPAAKDRQHLLNPAPQPGIFSPPRLPRSLTVVLCAGLLVVPDTHALDDIYTRADLRLRGYHTDHRAPARRETPAAPGEDGPVDGRDEDASGSGRLRVSLHADWTDMVTTRVTAQGTGLWGRRERDDEWLTALSEGYLELHNPGFSPLSLKAGRQYLHFGNGLIITDHEKDWSFDCARIAYDAFPARIDVLYASVAHLSPDTPVDHLWWANARHEFQDAAGREAEAYVGSFSLHDDGRPLLLGVRSTLYASPRWRAAGEAAYEFGTGPGDEALSAFAADGSVERLFPDTPAEPSLQARWTFASGDSSSDGQSTFIGALHHEDWGRVLSPRLSNIHVFALRALCRPAPKTTLSLELFDYRQSKAVADPASDANLNNGGFTVVAGGEHRHLGNEVNVVLGYEWSEACRLQLYAGHFMPGDAYDGQPGDETASEIRAEAVVGF